jgi:hypothetical protein
VCTQFQPLVLWEPKEGDIVPQPDAAEVDVVDGDAPAAAAAAAPTKKEVLSQPQSAPNALSCAALLLPSSSRDHLVPLAHMIAALFQP